MLQNHWYITAKFKLSTLYKKQPNYTRYISPQLCFACQFLLLLLINTEVEILWIGAKDLYIINLF